MAILNSSTNLTGTITLSKATGTKVTLDTDHKYLSKDIELTINAPTTTASASGLTVSYGDGWITGGSTTCSDANLLAANIKKDVTIFGVTGTMVAEALVISDTLDTNGGTIRTITTSTTPTMLQQKININPSTAAVTVTPDNGYDGMTSVQINGDEDLVAGNIKSGVNIFGVTGTYVPTGLDCPIFTVTIGGDNNISSISCNKTFAECIDYSENNDGTASISYPSWNFATGACLFYADENSITYRGNIDDIPHIEIIYASNGTITWNEDPVPYRDNSNLTASNLTVTAPAGYYENAASKTLTDSNLLAANIKNGVSIFGVTGSYNGQSTIAIVPEQTITTSSQSQSVSIPTVNDNFVSGETYIVTVDGTSKNVTAVAVSGITTEIVCPEQTITVNSQYNEITNYPANVGLTTGETYICTVDGTSYTSVATTDGSGIYCNFTTGMNFGYAPSYDGLYFNVSSANYGTHTIKCEHVTGSSTSYVKLVYTENNGDEQIVFEDYGSNCYFATYSSTYYGSHTIKVEQEVGGSSTLITKTITVNGTYDAEDDDADGYSSVTVNVPTGTARTSSDLTVSGATVNVPAGLYSSAASASVASGSASGPSSVSGTGATVSTGTNTLTLTKTVSITPTVSAGYVSTGTATNATVTLTGSVTTKAAATITPGTSDQTIASGTYLTGTQTISGDANLVASNIISGKSIFGVSGSVTIQHYYTGSGTPSSSTGVNGDIYLKTS